MTRRVVRTQAAATRQTVRNEAEDTTTYLGDALGDIRRLILFLIAFIVIVAIAYLLWSNWHGEEAITSENVSQSGATNFQPQGVQPAAQEPLPRTVREWRTAAWQRNDLFAQLKLGDLYAHDTSFGDPVEAAVWYFLALKNGSVDSISDDDAIATENDLLDKASADYQTVFATLTPEQREEARQRVIYILAHQDADGFITLGRLYRMQAQSEVAAAGCGTSDTPSAGWMATLEQKISPPPPVVTHTCRHSYDFIPSLIDPDDGAALMYFDIAQRMGHPLADVYVNAQTTLVTGEPNGSENAETARARARNWLPEFEYYPGQTHGGISHSDEGLESAADLRAYLLVGEIPPALIKKSLWLVGVYRPLACAKPCRAPNPSDDLRTAIAKFQDLLGDPQTGDLDPRQMVRLVRMAALRGDAEIQNELGIMYTKGIGVSVNYPRAQNWFERAAEQQFGEALYNLAILYKVGMDGVPQDADKAARLMVESAIAGFKPAKSQLRDLLSASKHSDPMRRTP